MYYCSAGRALRAGARGLGPWGLGCAGLCELVHFCACRTRNSFLYEQSQFSIKPVRSLDLEPSGRRVAAAGGRRPLGGDNLILSAKRRWPMLWRPVGMRCPNQVQLGLVRVCTLISRLNRGGALLRAGRIFLHEVRIPRRRRGFGLLVSVGRLFSVGWGSAEMCHRRFGGGGRFLLVFTGRRPGS